MNFEVILRSKKVKNANGLKSQFFMFFAKVLFYFVNL